MKKNRINWDSSFIHFLEVFIDLGLVLAGYMTILMVMGNLHFELFTFKETIDLVFSNILFFITSLIFFRIYRPSVTEKTAPQAIGAVLISLLLSNIFSGAIAFVIPEFSYAMSAFIYAIWVQLIYISIFKILLRQFIKKSKRKRALVIGTPENADRIARKIIKDRYAFIKVKYICHSKSSYLSKHLLTLIDEVDYVFIDEYVNFKVKNSVVNICLKDPSKDAFLIPRLYEISIVGSNRIQFSDLTTFRIQSLYLSTEQKIFKRMFDITFGSLAIIVLSPIFLITTYLIRREDGHSAIFRQERVNRDGSTFLIYKFRTMELDAEDLTGPVKAFENDTRVTNIGRFLRRYRIDELPQFINVIKGEMSIVGPRALRTEEIDYYLEENPNYQYRSQVKPGITGLAQTLGSYTTSARDKLRLDLLYIRNYSILNDMRILFLTIKVIFDKNSSLGISYTETLEQVLERFNGKVVAEKGNCKQISYKKTRSK